MSSDDGMDFTTQKLKNPWFPEKSDLENAGVSIEIC
jgi:hypothetical protein